MLNLDVIYDVTMTIKWEKVYKNEYVLICPTTSLPSFFKCVVLIVLLSVALKTHRFESCGSKSHSNLQS